MTPMFKLQRKHDNNKYWINKLLSKYDNDKYWINKCYQYNQFNKCVIKLPKINYLLKYNKKILRQHSLNRLNKIKYEEILKYRHLKIHQVAHIMGNTIIN